MSKQRKALALISGGLDSLLAARTIMDQGIHVEGVNFYTGFCVEGHTHAIRKQDKDKNKRNNALWSAEQLGIKLHIVDIVEEYKDIVINPKHGYGANMNPCLDCKIFMVQKALEWIKKNDFDFIITGEVVGQRPKSQRASTMPVVQKESGAEDLLLRPLCAKNLPETQPEREGWVARDKLHNFQGRTRKPQIALAAAMGFEDFAQPAGGCCFLTDESYSNKLGDLWEHRGEKRYDIDDIMLLKVGRHIRPAQHYKLMISREEGETRFMEGYRKGTPHLVLISHSGPMALFEGGPLSDEDAQLAARILARFSKGKTEPEVEVEYTDETGASRRLKVPPMSPSEIPKDWYL